MRRSVAADGTVRVSFDVTNTGTVAGSTVAQLYAAPQFTVPGAELPKERPAGFRKTAVLAPGHTQHVSRSVKVADLSRAQVTYRSSDPRVAAVGPTGVVTMRAPAPAAASIEVTVNGVTGTAPIVVRNPFTLKAAGIVKPNTTITASATFANTGGQAVRGPTSRRAGG